MADLKPGIIVQLPELKPSSQYYKALQSLRITGFEGRTEERIMYMATKEHSPKGRLHLSPGLYIGTSRLESYSAQTAMAVITHGGARFRVDTQHLRSLELRMGSLYQFIGELMPDPDFPSELMLQARVGRNVDGLDLDLYDKALKIRRRFEQKYLREASGSSSQGGS